MKKLLACLLTLTLALGAMLLPASAEGNVYTALYGSEVSTLNYPSDLRHHVGFDRGCEHGGRPDRIQQHR